MLRTNDVLSKGFHLLMWRDVSRWNVGTILSWVSSETWMWKALCDPMAYAAHGILQARILEWVAIPFSRGSSQPRDRTHVSRTAGGFFTSWVTREAHFKWLAAKNNHWFDGKEYYFHREVQMSQLLERKTILKLKFSFSFNIGHLNTETGIWITYKSRTHFLFLV